GKRSMNPILREYLMSNYPNSELDLMTVFMEVCPNLNIAGGFCSMINLPSWMFLSSYQDLRRKILSELNIYSLIENGRGVFGSDFGSVAFVLEKNKSKQIGYYKKLFVNQEKGKVEDNTVKKNKFINIPWLKFNNQNFLRIPGIPIAYYLSESALDIFENKILSDYSTLFQG